MYRLSLNAASNLHNLNNIVLFHPKQLGRVVVVNAPSVEEKTQRADRHTLVEVLTVLLLEPKHISGLLDAEVDLVRVLVDDLKLDVLVVSWMMSSYSEVSAVDLLSVRSCDLDVLVRHPTVARTYLIIVGHPSTVFYMYVYHPCQCFSRLLSSTDQLTIIILLLMLTYSPSVALPPGQVRTRGQHHHHPNQHETDNPL